MSWVASGMSMLPGLSPRPQHHLVNKKDFTEKVESTSNATFVSVRECEKGNIEVTGKVGKISLERSNGLKLSLDNPVVGGVLEVIKCQDVYIRLHQEGEVPTFQVDDSSNVTIEICTRSQIECLYYIRCQGLKLILNDTELDDDSSFQYEIPTEEGRANLQQIAHWSAASADASFVAEGVVRDGVYPTTAEMKRASDAKKQQMINGMASMLLGGIDIKKPEPPQDDQGEQQKPIPINKLGRETDDEKKEYFDDPETLSQKLDTLATWVKESKHCIFFTGAGISTSAGIPDFRSGMKTILQTGPGAWELRDAGKARDKKSTVKKLLQAIPTYTHLAIVKLEEKGKVSYVVSQNVDGLHLRSGLNPKALSELHGNTNLEKCSRCKKKYLRDYRTRSAKRVHDHKTGRLCADPKCRAPLLDSIINFGEDLPVRDLNRACEHAEKADLCISLGSSLTVSPANEIPEWVSKRKQKLVIGNLQNTPLHSRCDLAIYAMCDDVMRGLIERLGLEVDQWKLRRRIRVEAKTISRDDIRIKISGLDLQRDLTYSLFQNVAFSYKSSGRKPPYDVVKEKEPFDFKLPTDRKPKDKLSCTLHFHGHYAEEPLKLDLKLANDPKETLYDLLLVYDLEERSWIVDKM